MADLQPKITVIEGVPVYDVRAFYHKFGRAKYISQLDLYRTIQRAFQRAKLPIWYTQGFNPHIYLTFALPIALGYEGVNESFDFRLTTDIPLEEATKRLNDVMPEGIVIRAIQPPVRKANDIERADYELTMSCKALPAEQLSEKLNEFLSQGTIETEKRSKKGMKVVDLKPLILSQRVSCDHRVKMEVILPAGTQVNINPTLLTDAFAKWAEIDLDYHDIRRLKVLCADGTEFI